MATVTTEDMMMAITASLVLLDARCPLDNVDNVDYRFSDWSFSDAVGFAVNDQRRRGKIARGISLPIKIFNRYRDTFIWDDNGGYPYYTIKYNVGSIDCFLTYSAFFSQHGFVNLTDYTSCKFDFNEPDPDNIIKYTYYHSGIDVPYKVITATAPAPDAQVFPDMVQFKPALPLEEALWEIVDRIGSVYETVEIGLVGQNYKQAESFCNFTRYGLKMVDEENSIAIVEMSNPHIVLRDKATGQMSGNIPLKD